MEDVQIIIPVLVVAATGIVLLALLSIHRRRRKLKAWAFRNGLGFEADADKNFDSRHPFEPLQRGGGRSAENRMTGQWRGRPFLGFDYTYWTGSGSDATAHSFSGVILRGEAPLKPLLICPETPLLRVGSALGLDDHIEFESPEFNRRFYVASPDRKWAYDVIHQRTMELLLATPDYEIHFSGREVLVCRDKTFTLAEFETAARLAHGILDLLPDYLCRQQADTARRT